MPRVLTSGAGAIGSIYTYSISSVPVSASCSVIVVCRSNYAAISSQGFHISTVKLSSDVHAQPPVKSDGSDGIWDYILVNGKAFPGSQPTQASPIAPAVGPQTTIALLQNGIGIEDEYAAAFPNNPLLSGVVYLPVTQTAPGEIRMGEIELLELGTYPANAPEAHNARAAEFAEPRRRSKLLMNASWNPICALAQSSDVQFMASSPGATNFVWEVMLEVVKIAQALGYAEITEKNAAYQLERAEVRTKANVVEPSMLGDVWNNRQMEVEAIVGNLVRMARENDVEAVKLEALYILIKALDEVHNPRVLLIVDTGGGQEMGKIVVPKQLLDESEGQELGKAVVPKQLLGESEEQELRYTVVLEYVVNEALHAGYDVGVMVVGVH
ncbi:2-dehydropantoate 2-reductase [Cenococcum geophilum]